MRCESMRTRTQSIIHAHTRMHMHRHAHARDYARDCVRVVHVCLHLCALVHAEYRVPVRACT
jgi:hypothetical protein